jgi:hypothetical protein
MPEEPSDDLMSARVGLEKEFAADMSKEMRIHA